MTEYDFRKIQEEMMEDMGLSESTYTLCPTDRDRLAFKVGIGFIAFISALVVFIIWRLL